MEKCVQNVRALLVQLTAEKRSVKSQINALRVDADGKRRPETGPDRDTLWRGYVESTRKEARAAHLALGFLRGVPYYVMETEPAEPPSPSAVLATILASDESLKTDWSIGRVRALLAETAPPQEVAA